MTMEYFKIKICEELDGAKEYIRKAIELRPMNRDWSKIFEEMSSAEVSHASRLYKMSQEYFSKLMSSYTDEVPEYLVVMNDKINERFMRDIPEIEALKNIL